MGGGTLISGATSVSDGAANTTAIVNALGNNGGVPYAAKLCSDYAVDAFGNSCTPGSAGCYDDWFLPAYNFSNPLDPTDQLQCLWDNQSTIRNFTSGQYWSSNNRNANDAYVKFFPGLADGYTNKSATNAIRCVRNFTP